MAMAPREDFSRSERGDQSDPDFPVETEWSDDWFDRFAETSSNTLFALKMGVFVLRIGVGCPK